MLFRLKRLRVRFATLMFLSSAVASCRQDNKTTKELDGKAEYAYVLTMEKFDKLEEVGRAVGEWANSNEQTSETMQKDSSLVEGTLTQRVRIIDLKYAEFAAIIRKHGLSTQEYLLGTQVWVHALLLLDAKTHGETKDCAKNVNSANLAFVEQHLEEIRKNIRFRM